MVLSSKLEFLERVEHLPDVVVAFHHLVAVIADAGFPGELLGRDSSARAPSRMAGRGRTACPPPAAAS